MVNKEARPQTEGKRHCNQTDKGTGTRIYKCPPWDYGIVFGLRPGLAVAQSGGHSFILQYLSSWPIYSREVYSSCLYLVGPTEDELQLLLWPSSVPGLTRPCSKWGPFFVVRPRRLYLRRGSVVVIIIVHLEWGLSSSSSAHPGWSYTSNAFTRNALPGYGEGPGLCHFCSS